MQRKTTSIKNDVFFKKARGETSWYNKAADQMMGTMETSGGAG
jgi:hypothetical protein